ncbi:MAG: DNA-binding domain-containing protein [Pseudomonadota bacterium]
MGTQGSFRAALLDADAPVPTGLVTPQGDVATRRFGVYRNNVVQSLIEAMRASFPIIEKLIGPDNFTNLAHGYVRANPPASPLMMQYGVGFPDYLFGFGPLAHLGYLPDVARLELALRASYHAADATTLEPTRLGMVAEADLPRLVLRFAPPVRLVRSPWPLYDLWRFNTEDGAPKPQARAQDVLITRPEFDPVPHPLTQDAGAWINDLMDGAPLGEAGPEAFDPSQTIALLITQSALTDFTTKD